MFRDKKILLLLLILWSFPVYAHNDNSPPQLWSWFEDLDVSKKECRNESLNALETLRIRNIVQNQHGTYGTFRSNRVVVKCLKLKKNKSKLWVAVAGPVASSVESLRNKIINQIK